MEAKRDELTGRWTLSGVEPSEVTFERMCKMLREGENFKFARVGDGEANCMLGKVGHNCDGHEYFPDLGTALNNAFYSDPEYMVGIQPLMVQQGTWERLKGREGYPKNIYDADVLHSASIDGKLEQFIKSMQLRQIILVGPNHLKNIFPLFRFIEIPDKNCWNAYDLIHGALWNELWEEYDAVVLLCASMMSEVLIDDFKDSPNTFIDCGSVFDPLAGKFSRKYHHKLKHANL